MSIVLRGKDIEVVQAHCGEDIRDVIHRAIRRVETGDTLVAFAFNDLVVIVEPSDTHEALKQKWDSCWNAQAKS